VQQHELAAVVGSSGSGKSSVVFAGLLPRLRQQSEWNIAHLRPGLQPFDELARALIPLLESQMSETDRLVEARKLSDTLKLKTVPLWSVLNRIAQKDLAKPRLLLVVDQFEELYSAEIDDQTRRLFVDSLLTSLKPSRGKGGSEANIKLVLTLRADFMGRVLDYRPLADALQDRDLKLGPMTRQELDAAIRRPAEKSNLRFEARLVERILDDLITTGLPQMDTSNLPLLEFSLEQLWTLRTTDGLLTHEAYEAIGEVGGAISRYADELYEGLASSAQINMRRLLVQMVHPGGVEDTRRWVTRGEIGNVKWSFIEQLAAERLVVTDRDGTGQDIAEVIHEALIQKWGRMQGWMKEERPFRLWQDRMRLSLAQWRQEQSNDDLLRGTFLADSLIWIQKRGEDLTSDEIDFIQRGAVADSTLRRGIRRQQVGAGALGAAFVTGCVMAVIAYILYPDSGETEISRITFAYQLGVQGFVLGGIQGSVTIIGVQVANWLARMPKWYTRVLGGAGASAIIGGFLFVWFGVVQLFDPALSPGMLFALGSIVFGLSSGGASLVIDLGNPNWSLERASIGILAAGVLSFIAISSSYLWIDTGEDPNLFWPTVLGYTAVEMAISGGMYLGLNTIASRLRISDPVSQGGNRENPEIRKKGEQP